MQKPKHLPILSALCSFLLSLYSLLLPPPAHAAVSIQKVYLLATNKTLSRYITPLLKASIVGAGVIAFLLFLGGGFTMITSAGNPQDQQKGKSAVTAGVMGLVLVVSAYWIVQIIGVLTGIDLLRPDI
jgi:hypothetical protein